MRSPGEPPDTTGDSRIDPDGTGAPGARAFAGNAFWLLVSDLFSKVASFVLVVIIARGLGAEDYGFFNFAVSFVPIFLYLGTLGVDVEVFRALARDHDRLSRLFASGLVLRAVFGVIALLIAGVIGTVILEQREAVIALLVVGLALFLDEISRFIGTVFKAFERMRFHAVVVLVNRTLSTALAGVALALGGGLSLISGAYLLGSIGALGFAWLALRKFFPPVHLRAVSVHEMKALLKNGLHIGIASTVNMLTFRVDAVLLQIIRGPVAVAMYGIAYRFFESFLFVSWSLANVALPRIARSDGGRPATQPFQMALGLVLLVYVPIATGALFAADWVVTTVFSERYAPAGPAVVWLTWALVFYGLAYLARTATIALGRRRGIAQIAVGVLILNVGLNVVLIPEYGFMAAAAVTFATEVVDAILLTGLWLKTAGRFHLEGFVLVPIAAGAVMALVLWLLGASGPAAVAIGPPVYLAAMALGALLLAPNETRRALQTFRRRRLPAGAPADR
jgi:O-antigen/teichoic acid export membrane protein